MSVSRRQLLGTTFLAAATRLGAARRLSGLKIGVTDWNLRQTANVAAVSLAKRLGFAGVEVSLGRKALNDQLPLDNPESIAAYKSEFSKHQSQPAGTCLDILHVNYLKNDKLGEKWVADGIRVTKALGAKVMLLPFFGKGALETAAERDYVGDVLRNLAPGAEKAGVTLGLENTISARDNVEIMKRARSKAVLVYYDIGNSTRGGFDVVREIEFLDKQRICQMHFKDNPHYLGEGSIDMAAVLRAVSRIEFSGFANLETDSPSKSVEADMQRNLAFVRKTVEQVSST